MPCVFEKGRSVIALPSEYVCIDTETTGLEYRYCDIIELSAARVRDGSVIDSFSSLVRLDYALPAFITDLTGITDDMLRSAPPLSEVLPRFLDFCSDQIIVGHNVNFDICFVAFNAERIGRTFLNDYIDTLRIARKLFPDKDHHRLFEVASYCDVAQDQQHRAESDVFTTIACFEKMRELALRDHTEPEFIGLFKRHHVPSRNVMAGMTPRTDVFDDTHPFFGKRIVFTGALSRMTRKEAAQLVLDVGGIPSDGMNKETNYLVIGNEDFKSCVKDGKSAKMLKAEQMQKKGIDIQVISEDQFFDMIEL